MEGGYPSQPSGHSSGGRSPRRRACSRATRSHRAQRPSSPIINLADPQSTQRSGPHDADHIEILMARLPSKGLPDTYRLRLRSDAWKSGYPPLRGDLTGHHGLRSQVTPGGERIRFSSCILFWPWYALCRKDGEPW